MIHNSFDIVVVLLFIEITVLSISAHKNFKKYFQFLPPVFWIYFLPMLASTAGLIDSKSSVYQTITTNLLPASLFLLLIAVDIRAIMRLGKPALIMFFAGSLGIMIGTPLVFFLFKHWIGIQFWAGFGALSASWTGGSANMIAVKEALGTPDEVFLPMVIVDTIVPYVWMGILVALVNFQVLYDQWNRSDRRILDELSQRISNLSANKVVKTPLPLTVFIFLIAYGGGKLSQYFANFMPVVKDAISTYAWTIIIVSVLGILLSLTPTRKLDRFGSTRIGYLILYFVLTSIGAKANIAHIGSTLVLIIAGFLIVFVHAIVLLFTSRFIRAPLFLVAVASQANIGGVASAPIVAEIYQPGFASVGLLLAILGNIIGTYFGILVGQLCRWIAGS